MTRAQREENNESAALIQLPLSWIMLEIGDVADVISGGTPKANDPTNFAGPGQEIAWLTPADLSKYSEKYISHGARDLSQSGGTVRFFVFGLLTACHQVGPHLPGWPGETIFV